MAGSSGLRDSNFAFADTLTGAAALTGAATLTAAAALKAAEAFAGAPFAETVAGLPWISLGDALPLDLIDALGRATATVRAGALAFATTAALTTAAFAGLVFTAAADAGFFAGADLRDCLLATVVPAPFERLSGP
jgi:hypothetical protein